HEPTIAVDDRDERVCEIVVAGDEALHGSARARDDARARGFGLGREACEIFGDAHERVAAETAAGDGDLAGRGAPSDASVLEASPRVEPALARRDVFAAPSMRFRLEEPNRPQPGSLRAKLDCAFRVCEHAVEVVARERLLRGAAVPGDRTAALATAVEVLREHG